MRGASLSLQQTGTLEHRGLFSRFAGRLDGTPGDLSLPLKAVLDLELCAYRLRLRRQFASRWRCTSPCSSGQYPARRCGKSQESRVDSGEPDLWPLDSSRLPSELVLLVPSPHFGACVQGSGGSLIRCGRLPSLGVLRTASGAGHSLSCGAESWVLGPEALMSVQSR
ncbi:hypothetical protein MRX96_011780 [Rhipicephalus microplus]